VAVIEEKKVVAGNRVRASSRGIRELDDSAAWALWRLASVLIEIAQSESGESETGAPPSGRSRASASPKVESGD
jgi:hypothetical protein